jgi:protein-disulfide isomerase
VPPIGPADRVRGTASSERAVIVYGDYECPFCAALDQRLATAPVRFAFRHFPVRANHPRAHAAACAAEAAALQGAFWAMHDALFADQAHLEDEDLVARAVSLGLDEERFRNDLDDPALEARVREQRTEGEGHGFSGTPSFLVDGKRYDGFYDADTLVDVLG